MATPPKADTKAATHSAPHDQPETHGDLPPPESPIKPPDRDARADTLPVEPVRHAEPSDMVRAAVAPGRTVMAGDPPVPHGPGMIVEVTRADAAWLTEYGFLSSPGTPALPLGIGPAYGEERPQALNFRPADGR